jgi:hypothetical protein
VSVSPAAFPASDGVDEGRTRRVPRRRPASWDDVPEGPVPDSVLRYFEEAIAREEQRAARRAAGVPVH